MARGVATLQAPPDGVREPVRAGDAGRAGRLRSAAVEPPDQRDRFQRAAPRTVVETSARHRRPRPGPARAHALRRPHLARRRPGGDDDGDRRRRADRRDRRQRARQHRHRADVAHRPVPLAAAAAIAAADHLSLPRQPEERARSRGRRVRADRRGDRRLPLDAGGAAGARPVLFAARKGVRRGGARARRVAHAHGGPPHPAECARTGDRRRHHRRRRGDHRRVDALVPRPRLSAGHSDLGADPVRQQGSPRHRGALGAVSRRRRSSSPCCRSTSSATACATRSIRARCCDGRAAGFRTAPARDPRADNPLPHRRRLAARGRRRGHQCRPRRDGERRRRIGLRQDGHGDDRAQAGTDAAGKDRRRPDALAGARPRAARRRRDARASAPRKSRSSSRSR